MSTGYDNYKQNAENNTKKKQQSNTTPLRKQGTDTTDTLHT